MSIQAAVSSQKIGVFGGAFDPPHQAHVALAKTAIQTIGLDKLHVVPTGRAWHKARNLSAPEHRLAMTRLAFKSLDRVEVDSRELERTGPSFTIDTLQALRLENANAQLHLIMGADQFTAFRQWHQWQKIVDIAIICIAGRPHFNCPSSQFDVYKEQKERFITLPMCAMPVSATQIRTALALSKSQGSDDAAFLDDMVIAPVRRYISLHQLYRISS